MYGVNVNFLDFSGRILLYLVVEIGSFVVINMLLKSGGNVNECNNLFYIFVFFVVSLGRSVLLILIKNGVDINVLDEKGWIFLYVFLENGYIFVIKVLIEYNVIVNLKDKEGKIFLYLVFKLGNLNVVFILFKVNVIVNVVDSNWCIFFYYCILSVLLKLLIKNGVFVNFKDVDGKIFLYKVVEFFCRLDLILNVISEYFIIVNEFLLNDVNIVLRDNNIEIVIYKFVYVFNYYLLIEVLGFDFDFDEKDFLVIIVGDCLK